MSDTTTLELSPEAQAVNLDEFAGMTPDNLIGYYVALRDRLDAEKKAFSDRMKTPNETLVKLGGKMLEILNANGADSIKSGYGTVYKTTKKSATVSDMDQFRDYVINTGSYELTDMRANAGGIQEFIEEHQGQLPPGINFSQVVTVGVRRGSAKEE